MPEGVAQDEAGARPPSVLVEFEYPHVFQPGGGDLRDLGLALTSLGVSCRDTGEVLGRFDLRGAVPMGLHPVYGLSKPEPAGTWTTGPRSVLRLDLARDPTGGVRLEVGHLLPGPLIQVPAIVSVGRHRARCIFRGGTATLDLAPADDGPPLPPARGGKRALVVLGMHRSGTSALAGMLALAGAAPPADLMDAGADNPSGFWESVGISALNEGALNGVGSGWDDVFAAGWQYALGRCEPLAEAARLCLRRAYRGQAPIVLKDPRISLLLPLWRHVLAEEGYAPTFLITVRDPREVAESLRRRNGFAEQRSLLLWASHMLAAEEGTRGAPRHFVRFADLLAAPVATLAGLCEAAGGTGLVLTPAVRAAVGAFVRPRQPQHAGAWTGVSSRLSAFYDALVRSPPEACLLAAEARRIGQWLAELEEATGPILREARMRRFTAAQGERPC